MKLSKRLKHIDQMVTSSYDHIWDCCCDHGFLGAALLSRQAAPNIHFVDIVPELMTEVEQKLERFYAESESNWYTHCLDVAKLPLNQFSGKHLVIIAGVGGDLMTHFIESINTNYPELDIDFLLCPVHHQFTLRQKLIELNCSLRKELLLEDNKRFYEIILASSIEEEGEKISTVGQNIWRSYSPQQRDIVNRYLKATLSHYKRIQAGNRANVQHMIDAYMAVEITTTTELN